MGRGRNSGLNKRRQAHLAFKLNEIRKRRSKMVNLANVDTFLPPIEKPQGLIMKLTYYFTRLQFGKVLTPLKVHSARLPLAFGLFYSKIGRLDKKLLLPPELVMLIREQVARINFYTLVAYDPQIIFRYRFTGADITRLNLKYPITNQEALQFIRSQNVPRSFEIFDENNPNPYAMQWTFDIQRQLTPTLALQA